MAILSPYFKCISKRLKLNFYCVVVTYNPEIALFQKVMKSILNNTKKFVIVDNNSMNKDEIISLYPNNIILLDDNLGIAKAQNIGIKFAIENDADFIWLSDQDTIYPRTYIQSMNEEIKVQSNLGNKYAAIGPAFIERNRKEIQSFIKFSPFSKKVISNSEVLSVSQLIASGMIIPINVLFDVGFKNEDLFIDWVDLEWCWRALKKDYIILGNSKVLIEHTLGDQMVYFLGKKISIRSPFRHYFIIRNGIYLSLNSKSINYYIKFEIFFKSCIWMILYPLLAKKNKIKHFKAVLRGFYHGITGKLGSF